MTFGKNKKRRQSKPSHKNKEWCGVELPIEASEEDSEIARAVEVVKPVKDSGDFNKRASSEINTADLLTNNDFNKNNDKSDNEKALIAESSIENSEKQAESSVVTAGSNNAQKL